MGPIHYSTVCSYSSFIVSKITFVNHLAEFVGNIHFYSLQFLCEHTVQGADDKLGQIIWKHSNYLCTCYLYTPVHNVLEAWIYITWGSWRGLGPGIPEFFRPCEMASSRRRVPFGAQKTREFQGPTPSNFPK